VIERSHLYVRAQITRWVDDSNPGFVECRFTDRYAHEWVFVEKLPVVTGADLWSGSEFPKPAFIACEIVSHGRDEVGRETYAVNTEKPWCIAASDGTTSFHVFADQLIELADWDRQ
jgi:hypothetical protein